jgi:polyhydroxyalkanoate synthase
VILDERVVEQAIDSNERRLFRKELCVVSGPIPLSMVRKRAFGAQETRGAVLLVHGFGQNRYTWHLPSRSFVNYLAGRGFDVFNLDLRGHGRSRALGAPRARSIADYVLHDLPAAIRAASAMSDNRRVFVVGHSLGGLVAYAGATLAHEHMAGLATLGSPYRFGSGSLSLSTLALFVRAVASARLPIAGAPLAVRPVGHLMRHVRRFAESRLYPIPIRGWHVGALEPHVLDQHLRLAFDRASVGEAIDLCEGILSRKSRRHRTNFFAEFDRLDLPLLVVGGAHDDMAPLASVRPAYDRSRAADKTYRVFPHGHIDLVMGHAAPRSVWRTVSSWIEARVQSAAARAA